MLLDNLPHKCTIARHRHSKGPSGGRSRRLVTVSENVECWEQSSGSTLSKEFQQSGFDNTRKVYFTDNPNIGTQHSIIITERNGVSITAGDQVELEVIGSARPDVSAGKGILYRVMCKVLTQTDSKDLTQ